MRLVQCSPPTNTQRVRLMNHQELERIARGMVVKGKGILAAGPATVIEHHISQRGQDHHPRSTSRVPAGHVQQLHTPHGVLIHDPHQAGAIEVATAGRHLLLNQ